MKKSITDYFLQQTLKKQLNRQKRRAKKEMDLRTARSISILFDATDPENRARVLDFAQALQQKGKKIYILAFLNDKEKHERSFPFDYFNVANINWVGVPKSHKIDNFLSKQSDIFFNMSPKAHLSLEFIATLVTSHFKIGTYTNQPFGYDVIFPAPTSVSAYIRQINYFLTKQSVLQYERESALV